MEDSGTVSIDELSDVPCINEGTINNLETVSGLMGYIPHFIKPDFMFGLERHI